MNMLARRRMSNGLSLAAISCAVASMVLLATAGGGTWTLDLNAAAVVLVLLAFVSHPGRSQAKAED